LSDDPLALALFFTRGTSLAIWDERGILERELALYRRLAERRGRIAFLTYGAGDGAYAARLPEIEVVPKRPGLPDRAYGPLLPLLGSGVLRRAAVYKTNQVYGGIAALRAAQLHRRPLIARCGFLWSEVAAEQLPAGSWRLGVVRALERRLFRGAGVVQVTTERIRDEIVRRHGVAAERIVVVPNFVDLERFRPAEAPAPNGSFVFVGRLSPEKNLAALIEALAGLDEVSLTIVGDGPLRPELEALADRVGLEARFAGRVPNERLPELLRGASVFAAPSLYEGHPKAVLEAMAAGLPVLGADVQGIREVVRDGETGVLAATDAGSLRSAAERLLDDAPARLRMGEAGRAAAQAFSLDAVVERELEVIERARRSR
jgi:glycosyltransferase involved in cell wall biosynthesis